MIVEIKYFRPDGKDRQPSGVCYYNAGMYKEIENNERSFIRTPLTESFLGEDIGSVSDQYGFSKYRGGMIVFALSVNALIDDMEKNRLKNFLKKIYYSTMNYVFKDASLNKLIKKWNAEFGSTPDMSIGAMTIGNNFKGKYQVGDKIYNDRSTSLELGGVPSELLLLFAIEICKAFRQDTVLVKDFNTNKIFLVNGNDIVGKSASEKLANANKDLENLNNINVKN